MPKVRTPGVPADAVDAAPEADAVDAVEIIDEDSVFDDKRTPGLTVNEDGTITYQGKTHKRAFMTPHGMVVPPASVDSPGQRK